MYGLPPSGLPLAASSLRPSSSRNARKQFTSAGPGTIQRPQRSGREHKLPHLPQTHARPPQQGSGEAGGRSTLLTHEFEFLRKCATGRVQSRSGKLPSQRTLTTTHTHITATGCTKGDKARGQHQRCHYQSDWVINSSIPLNKPPPHPQTR